MSMPSVDALDSDSIIAMMRVGVGSPPSGEHATAGGA
jgi:hypothetical protein